MAALYRRLTAGDAIAGESYCCWTSYSASPGSSRPRSRLGMGVGLGVSGVANVGYRTGSRVKDRGGGLVSTGWSLRRLYATPVIVET